MDNAIEERVDPIERLQSLMRKSYYAKPILESTISILKEERETGKIKIGLWLATLDNARMISLELDSAAHVLNVARSFLLSMVKESEDQEGEEQ